MIRCRFGWPAGALTGRIDAIGAAPKFCRRPHRLAFYCRGFTKSENTHPSKAPMNPPTGIAYCLA